MSELTAGGLAGGGSPDRMDALVWALTELMIGADGTAIIEFYRQLVQGMRRGGGQIIEGRAQTLVTLRIAGGLSAAYTLSGEVVHPG